MAKIDWNILCLCSEGFNCSNQQFILKELKSFDKSNYDIQSC